ncbi:LysR substrate-binding domain-containing protein [uncultured Methylobacterium sp.]|uniref:LysR substrate-binding domain-containing protein n=1 Tax=uncultured Methylobacterium sp. TaxID=157278 RepID=UPI0035CC7D0C
MRVCRCSNGLQAASSSPRPVRPSPATSSWCIGRKLRRIAHARFKLGAIMAPDHPLAGCERVSLAACFDHPVILPEGDLSTVQILAPALARLSRNVRPIVRSSSTELMRALAERGVGLAFQTRIGLEQSIAGGRLVHVPVEAGGPIWSELGVYVRSGRALPAIRDLVLRILVEEIARREPEDPGG